MTEVYACSAANAVMHHTRLVASFYRCAGRAPCAGPAFSRLGLPKSQEPGLLAGKSLGFAENTEMGILPGSRCVPVTCL